MAIEYEVAINKLTTPETYSARVRPKGTVGLDALIRDIAAQSSLSESDVRAVIIALRARVESALLAGNRVAIDGLVQLSPSIKAKMAGPTDPLPANAQVNLTGQAARSLSDAVRQNATLQRIEATNLSPSLLTVSAVIGSLTATQTDNVIEIKGERLSFDKTQADEGVFLVRSTGTAVRATNYLNTGAKMVRFAVPSGLAANTDYALEVRARRTGSHTLRTGRAETMLHTA